MNPFASYALSDAQRGYAARALAVAQELIAPRAAQFDEREAIPKEIFEALAREGFLGANVAEQYGGCPVDNVSLGLLHQALGASCTSVRSILTVHGMVCEVLQRFGSAAQKATWLPKLARGEAIAAFALTEPHAGSDAAAVSTNASASGPTHCLSGEKRWITGGQIADVFLVIAKGEKGAAAYLVTPDASGFSRTAVHGMLGQRGAMLASLTLERCTVLADSCLGRSGFGAQALITSALDFGRYTVAWGCVGIIQACFELSLRYAADRQQFGQALVDHQLVRALITELMAGARSCALLCLYAGSLRDRGEPDAVRETCLAKYVSARTCAEAAGHAVQIHGATGCGPSHPAQRLYRDAKIMEIIEGTTQIQQDLIARLAYDGLG